MRAEASTAERGVRRSFIIGGYRLEAPAAVAGLHVVATPIGNLGDITLRALETLAGVEAVLAEDTRVSRRLLAHYGVTTPLERYDEHAGAAARPGLLARLEGGAALALISDAGTPLVSDPGYRLVTEAVERGIIVHALPGASAVMAALVSSALPTDRFTFEGFLPPKEVARRRRIKELEATPGTLVLFESPHRILDTLSDLAIILGERPAATARELTKLHETVRRGTLPALAAEAAADGETRGEHVILVGPAESGAPAVFDLDRRLGEALERHSVKDAASIVAAEAGLPRRDVYARALALAPARRDA